MSLHSIMVVRFLPHKWVNYFHILWRHWRHWCVSKNGYGPIWKVMKLTFLLRYFKWLLEIFNEPLMFSGFSRLKLDNMKLYIMLQDVDMDEVSNFFNISFKNKLQYKLLAIFYLFVFSGINRRKWACWSEH